MEILDVITLVLFGVLPPLFIISRLLDDDFQQQVQYHANKHAVVTNWIDKGRTMAFTKYKEQGLVAKSLRKEAGQYVKSLRVAKEMTQRDLSQRLGLDYYTFISQVENGAARVPPEGLLQWAKALDVDGSEFATKLLSYYDPYMYEAIFGGPP